MIAHHHAGRPILRIVTWNCQMALRKKHDLLASLHPDIAVIQECEGPDKLGEVGATAVHWHGDNPHKGLAILSYGDWRLEPVPQLDPEEKFVLPVRITGGRTFHLLGVWAKKHPVALCRQRQPLPAAGPAPARQPRSALPGHTAPCPAHHKP